MAFTILDSSGPIVSVKITGELSVSEVGQIQAAALEAIKRAGKIKGLAILENFRGWKREGNWGDVTFLAEHDQDIAKIAIVGDEKWKDSFYAFLAKGFRRAAVEYFLPADIAKARAWLEADNA
jgi:SpoIIAA-like